MGVAYSVGEMDYLSTYFVQWSPDIYTKGNKKQSQPSYIFREKEQKHYLVVEKEEVDVNMLLSNPERPPVNKWKIITAKDLKRWQSVCSSEDSEAEDPEYQGDAEGFLPVLSVHSQLLEDHHLKHISAHLPARTEGHQWQLAYSTATHGTSLRTLYRNMAELDGPVLLVIKDMHNKVFGAFSSDPFRVSNYCYGTGEAFLYTFSPDFKAYRWSGENSYFVRGHLESLQIGGGGGVFGLWLDADLYHGTSYSCPTFHNEPLSTQQDFIIQELEVWTM